MFESGLRTTSYANRVAQGRLFCVWDPLVTYLSRYFNSLRANQFQPIANEKCWYRRWYFRFDINLY